jgi:hypothetical protein
MRHGEVEEDDGVVGTGDESFDFSRVAAGYDLLEAGKPQGGAVSLEYLLLIVHEEDGGIGTRIR